jgi:hypothetical protein
MAQRILHQRREEELWHRHRFTPRIELPRDTRDLADALTVGTLAAALSRRALVG